MPFRVSLRVVAGALLRMAASVRCMWQPECPAAGQVPVSARAPAAEATVRRNAWVSRV